jgi:hypothetical protein
MQLNPEYGDPSRFCPVVLALRHASIVGWGVIHALVVVNDLPAGIPDDGIFHRIT